MKISGLQNTAHIYDAAEKGDYSRQTIYNKNDPYWMDWMAKNSRREDNWRHPSMHAYVHKPNGILGEIIDIDKMREKQN